MARAIIVNAAGTIVRQIQGSPDLFHLQCEAGQTVFALTVGDEGQAINGLRLEVSPAGQLALRAGTALRAGETVPDIQLDIIVA